MGVFEIIYNIIIGPLKYIFEIIFSIGYILTGSAGLGIVILSFVLNILLLPLYKKAEELQAEENEIQTEMKPDLDFIKKTFSGNERFYITQTYYRQHNYKPIYSLRSSISLLLQIPFFIAAYDFLSNFKELNGVSSLFIHDLGKPDGLLFGLNLLPILMTIVNVISTIIYTKGQPFKQKMQLYIMALLFLILLYKTPAALSFYYLMNNVFSLFKNWFNKLDNKHMVLGGSGILVCIVLLVSVIKYRFLFTGFSVILIGFFDIFLFFISFYCLKYNKLPTIQLDLLSKSKYGFFICCLFICVFTGLFIPSSVINASPEEFISHVNPINPIGYIFQTFSLSFGLFVFWFGIYYLLVDERIKRLFYLIMWVTVFVSAVNYFFFSNNFGTMSNHLIYDDIPLIGIKDYLINLIVVLLVSLIAFVVWLKRSLISKGLLIIVVSFLIITFINMININKVFAETKLKLESNTMEEKIFPFSKTNKNVVVFMLDRAISTFFPYILKEKPKLQEQFRGFTYYPNTISFGGTTNVGTPSLFGGYEYTPEELNKRDTELLKDKQNEALSVLPVLFDRNNFETVVCDPPYAGYTWIPDLSIYDDYPDIKSYITIGSFGSSVDDVLGVLNRNLFSYSISKIVPSIFFNIVYNNGTYLSAKDVINSDKKIDISVLMDNYRVLEKLPELTSTTDEGTGLFLMIQNSTTHETTILQEPDYIPLEVVDNSDYAENDEFKESIYGEELRLRTLKQMKHYHVNMTSMIQLGKWFDYLKKNDIWDNTRIIIVSDHGFDIHLIDKLSIYDDDMLSYNALLLVKDFDSSELSVDNSFMTLADVPYLATKDVISDPENVFTGNKITEKDKKNVVFNIFNTQKWNASMNNGNTFSEDSDTDIWYSVHDDCLNPDNWERIDKK